MPVDTEEFQIGVGKWKLEYDNPFSPPYLKDLTSNKRYQISRDINGIPQLHLNGQIPVEAIVRLTKAFHDWENGVPTFKLSDGWEWEQVKGTSESVWGAVNVNGTSDRCFIDPNGVVFSVGAPMNVVEGVFKAWEARKGLYKANAATREAFKTDEAHQIPTRSDLIREGALNED